MAEHTIYPYGESVEQPTRIPLSNDWNDSSRQHASSARQMNLVYNNLLTMHNNLVNAMSALANSAFKTSHPTISELDWVGDATAYSIGYSLTHCHKSASSPTSVAEGDSFTAEILPDEGYTLNGVMASGSGFSQSYDSVNNKIIITASNVQNGMTIGCTAVTYQVSVNYNLTGFESESNTNMQSGGSFVKELSPNTGYKVKTIVITMGGVTLDNSQVWDASSNTITIPVVTGDIVITATAEESTAHTITYNLTGATKSSNSDVEVEDGESLTAVISKGADYPSSSEQGSGYVVGLLARDIVVLMGGQPLERGVDFSVQQSAPDANITITIEHVTGNVEIMNILWKTQYICFRDADYSDTVTPKGGVRGSNSSAHTENYIKLPSSCGSLAIFGRNVNSNGNSYMFGPTPSNNDYAWGCALYDANHSCVAGEWLGNDSLGEVVTVPTGAVYIRTSAWMNNTPNAEHINACFIYDITNDKFIWCGNSVNKATIRSNYQNNS
jgi:hypothetical protein